MENNVELSARKKFVVQALIGKIKKDNEESKIKTDLVEGFRKPDKIIKKNDEKSGYVPDVMAESDGRVDLYEIEMHERNYTLEKWRLFSLFSRKTNGSLNIVVPKSNLDTLKNMLDDNKIHANIIYYT
jgi:hypothetical protein